MFGSSMVLASTPKGNDSHNPFISNKSDAFSFGVELGGSLVSLQYREPPEYYIPGGRASFNGMVFGEILVGPTLQLQSGFRFVSLGGRLSLPEYPYERDGIRRTFHAQQEKIFQHYLLVPLRFIWNPLQGPVSFFCGPEPGLLLTSYSAVYYPEIGWDTIPISSFTKLHRFNLSFHGGVRIPIRIARQNLYLQMQYSHGLFWKGKAEWIAYQTSEISVNIGYFIFN